MPFCGDLQRVRLRFELPSIVLVEATFGCLADTVGQERRRTVPEAAQPCRIGYIGVFMAIASALAAVAALFMACMRQPGIQRIWYVCKIECAGSSGCYFCTMTKT